VTNALDFGSAALAPGETLDLAFTGAGNGFSVDAINVTLSPLAIFDLRAPLVETLDEAADFTLPAIAGISPNVSTPDGVLNQTAASFGVNATGTGDVTSQIDDGVGVDESIDLMFDQDVYLEWFTLSSFSSTDMFELMLPGMAPIVFGGSDLFTGTNVLNLNAPLLPAGQKARLQFASGNGFSFDGFAVSAAPVTVSNVVPEPAAGALFLIAGAGLCVRRRRHSA